MSILARYLSATILKHYLMMALVAVVVASVIAFLENRDGLMDDPSVTLLDGLRFSMLNAPGVFSLLAGLVALMSVLIATVTLLRHSELKAMLAAGLGHGRMMLALAPAAVLMFGIHFLMENIVLPRSAAELHEWGIGQAWKRQPGETEAIWSRDGDYIVSVTTVHGRDRALAGVELFALGPSGELKWQITAPVGARTGSRGQSPPRSGSDC
jgi:lipopolysaccharide export LptBFGC system permease protein LptF